MAYSSDTYYTWIAQGKSGYSAAPVTYSTVTDVNNPLSERTVGMIDNFSTIHEWNDYASYYADTTTRITIPLSGGDISKLVLQNRGNDTVWVEVYDLDNNRVSSKEFGFGVSAFEYNRWCTHTEEGVTTQWPLQLCIQAIPGTAPPGGIHFSFAGEVTPFSLVEWDGFWTNHVSLYGASGGDRELQLFDELLDGHYLDSEGIAPTGGTGGGGGYFSRPDEVVGVPSLPTVSVCDTGFVSLYKVTTGEMQALATYMWDPTFYNSIVKNFQSPMENIITLQVVPFNPTGDVGNIIIGNLDTGISSTKLNTTYFHISCGQKNVQEFYRSFADYSPYTPQIGLFLPFIGQVSLSPDDCMNGSIKIDYNIDVFSGSCVAFVSCNTNGVWHVLQQHQGTITSPFPLSGQNYTPVYSGILSAAASVMSGGGGGNAASVMGGALNAGAHLMNIKPDYLRGGSVGSTAGLLGTQYPYLIFTTPQYIMAENFRDVKGYTSNLKCTVSSCSGFFQATADNSELSGISNATADELEMIRSLLADGIYV